VRQPASLRASCGVQAGLLVFALAEPFLKRCSRQQHKQALLFLQIASRKTEKLKKSRVLS
jgi:hypothetical protein